ncbi:MAG: hypothetical protein FWG89_00025 [Treponema sp.]|nr:hypothetical protein [Treponema sp.]
MVINGNKLSNEKKPNHTIAAYSWAIAFNPAFIFSKSEYLFFRGAYYHKINEYDLALNDFIRTIQLDPDYRFAYFGWEAAYFRKNTIGYGPYSVGPAPVNNLRELYAKTYNLPDNWAYDFYYDDDGDIKRKPYSDFIYNDLFLAIVSGGCQKAIDFANTAMENITNSDWDNAYTNFCNAISADSFFKEIYTKESNEVYIEAIDKIQQSIKRDLDYYSKTIKPGWREIIQKDDFYQVLQEFLTKNGEDIFDRHNFNALFDDHLGGEYKKEAVILKNLLEKQVHQEIRESENIDETKEQLIQKHSGSLPQNSDIITRIILILCDLLKK